MTNAAATTETLTAYLADRWNPSFLGLVEGPNTKNAGFTSLQVAGTYEQFVAALAQLVAERKTQKGGEKASYTAAIKHLASAVVSAEGAKTREERKARFAELTA